MVRNRDELSNFLNIFYRFLGVWLPWTFVIFNWPLIGLEMLMSLKNYFSAWIMFSKSLTKHFKGFGSWFTELHAELDTDRLLDFVIHCRQNETWSRKSTRVKTMHVYSAVPHGRLCNRLAEVWPWPPLVLRNKILLINCCYMYLTPFMALTVKLVCVNVGWWQCMPYSGRGMILALVVVSKSLN
jgi:hypothetical protein